MCYAAKQMTRTMILGQFFPDIQPLLPFKDAKANIDGTYIIETDLFLETKQLLGTTRDALTKPLKSILKK